MTPAQVLTAIGAEDAIHVDLAREVWRFTIERVKPADATAMPISKVEAALIRNALTAILESSDAAESFAPSHFTLVPKEKANP
jgi:hypothetical protein